MFVTIGAFLIFYINAQHNRNIALSAINNYILKQGIKKSDIKVSTVVKQNDGLFNRYIYVDGEKPNIEYEYFYRPDIKQVYFTAQSLNHKMILKHEWAGGELTTKQILKLKCPPLKNSFGYGSKYDKN